MLKAEEAVVCLAVVSCVMNLQVWMPCRIAALGSVLVQRQAVAKQAKLVFAVGERPSRRSLRILRSLSTFKFLKHNQLKGPWVKPDDILWKSKRKARGHCLSTINFILLGLQQARHVSLLFFVRKSFEQVAKAFWCAGVQAHGSLE